MKKLFFSHTKSLEYSKKTTENYRQISLTRSFESIHYGSDRMFKGLVDQINIYESVLQQIEIQSVKERESTLAVSNEVSPDFGLNVYANPFISATTLSYQISTTSQISLKIYYILGNEVITLARGMKQAGNYEITFNVSHLSGVICFAGFTVTPQNKSKSYANVNKVVLTR